jgi:hypothetical protein
VEWCRLRQLVPYPKPQNLWQLALAISPGKSIAAWANEENVPRRWLGF